MILLDEENKNQVITFIPLIQENYADWHMVNIKFNAKDKGEATKIIGDFIEGYKDTSGFVYIESNTKAVSVIRLGRVKNYSDLQDNIEQNIKGKRCKVLARKMSASGLKKIQINLLESVNTNVGNKLFIEREDRERNIILVADDDMFIRKTLKSLLQGVSEIHEVDKGDAVLPIYKKINPDIVLLDIHMPNENGLDVIENLNKEDSSVFILVSSSDAIRSNVLKAMERGAIGFLAKPVRKDKLFMYLEQCITFRKEELCNKKRKY